MWKLGARSAACWTPGGWGGPRLGCSESCRAQIVLIKQASAWGVNTFQFMLVPQEVAGRGLGPMEVISHSLMTSLKACGERKN